jgi:hypothetical protein
VDSRFWTEYDSDELVCFGTRAISAAMNDSRKWFAVRFVFQRTHQAPSQGASKGEYTYEERVTLWKAESSDDAIRQAEAEAADYTEGGEWVEVDMAQAFWLFDEPVHGAEVFSLMRDSQLPAEEYVDHFFETGTEHQGTDG